jgi:hypothetical protein
VPPLLVEDAQDSVRFALRTGNHLADTEKAYLAYAARHVFDLPNASIECAA